MTILGRVPKSSIRTDITELNEQHIGALLADWTYASVFPVKCEACGGKSGFSRRIFRITGIEKPQYSDEAIQGVLRRHLAQKHEIESIVFRTLSDILYVDSAICSGCKSTRVVYDISVRSTLMALAGRIRNWITSFARTRKRSKD